MKKIIIELLILFVVFTITLQGCIEQNNIDTEFVTAPLNNLGLNLTDLPDNIYPFDERYNDTVQVDIFSDDNITKLEEYSVDYRYKETDSYYMLFELRKIESTEDAKKVFESQKNAFTEYATEEIPLGEIGNQSILGKVGTRYHLILREYNIILTITSTLDTEITEQEVINYATIVVNNIESSMQS